MMETLARIKDALLDYLQRPAKRLRTIVAPCSGDVTRRDTPQDALFLRVPEATYVETKHTAPAGSSKGRSPRQKRKRNDDDQIDVPTQRVQTFQNRQLRRIISDESEVDTGEDMSSDEKVERFLSHQQPAGPAVVENLSGRETWTEEEKLLHLRMELRSEEPLMPLEWRNDFPTIGDNMFTTRKTAFLRSVSGDEARACRKFTQLFNNVKNISTQKGISGRPSEMIVTTLIRNYVLYTEKDGGYSSLNMPPLTIIIAAPPGQKLDALLMAKLTEKATTRMNNLAARHRQYHALPLSETSPDEDERPRLYRTRPPVIYGFLIAQRRVAVFTHDTSTNQLPKFMIALPINDPKMAFWNAIGVALVATCARNAMLAMITKIDAVKKGVK